MMAAYAYVIKDSADKIHIIQMQNGVGTQTMDQILRDLVLRGTITYEDAMGRSRNPAELEVIISLGMAQMQTDANRRRNKESQ